MPDAGMSTSARFCSTPSISAASRGATAPTAPAGRRGDHSHLVVPRNRTGEHRWTTDAQTGALIRDLARMLPDELIAGLLNRLGKKTGKGNSWTKGRVCSFRSSTKIRRLPIGG